MSDSSFLDDPTLQTTWRTRCANGLQHPHPDSPEACWRAALPPLSKYCSQECAIIAMERKLGPAIAARAGEKYAQDEALPITPASLKVMQGLYEEVRDSKRRGAVVVDIRRGKDLGVNEEQKLKASYEKLSDSLFDLERQVQILSRELGFVLARGRLAELAIQWSEKPENSARCAFDFRLLLEAKGWEEWVQGEGKLILETGDLMATSGRESMDETGDEDKMDIGEGEEGDIEETSCDGRRKCERHLGWQKLYWNEFELNKGTKVRALSGF